MTITKAQGHIFDRVEIYLPSPVFSHDQLYRSMAAVVVKKIADAHQQGKRGGFFFKSYSLVDSLFLFESIKLGFPISN